ncbi:MAG: hypothetical protein JNM83_13215 [Myxococcales bacterium]|jgi:chromosome segregation ATPase|nr:hypothetical protein [Myxococcales bacterium]
MPSTVRTPTAPPNEPPPKPHSRWPLYLSLLALLFSVGSSGWLLIRERAQQTENVQLRVELTVLRQELLTLRQAHLTQVVQRDNENKALHGRIARIPSVEAGVQKLEEVQRQQVEVKQPGDEAKRLLAETGELVKKLSLLPSELQALSKRAADLQNSNIGQDKKLEQINKDLEEKKKAIEFLYGSLSELRNQVNKVPPKK